jgi:hypothetical protein
VESLVLVLVLLLGKVESLEATEAEADVDGFVLSTEVEVGLLQLAKPKIINALTAIRLGFFSCLRRNTELSFITFPPCNLKTGAF